MIDFKIRYNISIEDHVINSEKTDSENGLQKAIDKYGLFVLMLNSKGEIRTVIDSEERDRIRYLVRKLNDLTTEQRETMNDMADEIVLLTASLLKVFGEDGKIFQKYFRQFAMVELLEHHLSGKISFVRKEGQMIDYKINRVAKYLNIDLNREEIRDFEVMYTGDIIKLNGQEYYKREETQSDLPKINKIVRQ